MKDGYISKYKEKNYATKIRKLEKSDLTKHTNRDEIRKEIKPSSSDSNVESWEIKEKEVGTEVETTKEILENTFWNPFKDKKKRKKKDDPC